MNKKLWDHTLIFIFIITGELIFLISCRKPEINVSSVTDIEGNTYKTVKIGNQWWMAENLRTTKLNDGTDITLASAYSAWTSFTTSPEYCFYNFDVTNYSTYGALYCWYSVNTKKLCPAGWHVPTDPDWTIMTTYLGGENVSGGRLKETGIIHWNCTNNPGTNESGFTALPGGALDLFDPGFYSGPRFQGITENCYWWSSSQESIYSVWFRSLVCDYNSIGRHTTSISSCYSVRCLKD